MNIPGLRKLDTLLIVCNFILLVPNLIKSLDNIEKINTMIADQIIMNRRLSITSDKKKNFGMRREKMIKRMKTARGMTNGGIRLLRFLQMGYQKHHEDGCSLKRSL